MSAARPARVSAGLASSFDTVIIREVLPNTPASEADLRVGDEVIAVDGKPAVPKNLDEIREAFREHGRSFSLTIRRDGAQSTVTLVTRRLI